MSTVQTKGSATPGEADPAPRIVTMGRRCLVSAVEPAMAEKAREAFAAGCSVILWDESNGSLGPAPSGA